MKPREQSPGLLKLKETSQPNRSYFEALCEAFDVIVVRRVPRFASSDENAARRFASLVDVMRLGPH